MFLARFWEYCRNRPVSSAGPPPWMWFWLWIRARQSPEVPGPNSTLQARIRFWKQWQKQETIKILKRGLSFLRICNWEKKQKTKLKMEKKQEQLVLESEVSALWITMSYFYFTGIKAKEEGWGGKNWREISPKWGIYCSSGCIAGSLSTCANTSKKVSREGEI